MNCPAALAPLQVTGADGTRAWAFFVVGTSPLVAPATYLVQKWSSSDLRGWVGMTRRSEEDHKNREKRQELDGFSYC